MSKILAEISAGEFFDKLSILEIKLNKIKDLVLLNEVKKEYEILNETKNNIQTQISKNIRLTKLIKNFILQKISIQ